MIDRREEPDARAGTWVERRELDKKFENSSLIHALLNEIDPVPDCNIIKKLGSYRGSFRKRVGQTRLKDSTWRASC